MAISGKLFRSRHSCGIRIVKTLRFRFCRVLRTDITRDISQILNRALTAMIRQTKHTTFPLINCHCWGIAVIAVFTCLVLPQDMHAQDLGGPGGGLGIDDLQQLPNDGGLGTGGIGGGGIGGGGIGGGGGDNPFAVNDQAFISESTENVRNQGFVGATGQRIQSQGFVGPPGESLAPPLVDGATFGGGVNDSAAGGGGGGFGGGNAGGNQTGFGAAGQGKGFQVIRRGVRTALTPRFASPTYAVAEIPNRFNSRIRRQPVISNDSGGLFVSVNQRVATVTGFAQSQAERDRFIRQLRLEPGIDQIVDQSSSQ